MKNILSIKKTNYLTPDQMLEKFRYKRYAAKAVGCHEGNWTRDSANKLVANIGDAYWFVPDLPEIRGNRSEL